jgi:hypothetical protein
MIRSLIFQSWWLAGLALMVGGGCHPSVPSLFSSTPTAATLTLAATPLGQGAFEVTGDTNLPDETPLGVVALRYLHPQAPDGQPQPPTYSILAFRPVTVRDGQWQTRLDLWNVDEQGRYHEVWERYTSTLNLDVTPEERVQFAVILAPRHLRSPAQVDLAQAGIEPPASLLRLTPAGESFLWAEQSLTVALPTGSTTPPLNQAHRYNGGWGDRYRLVTEPPLPYTLTAEDERQTTAPPSPDEFLR